MTVPQTQRVARWLLRHGSITPLDAMNDLRCWRLGARIFDLRKELGQGVIETKNELHEGGVHARYELRQPMALAVWLSDRENDG